MEKPAPEIFEESKSDIKKAARFSNLFAVIKEEKLGADYREAYEEAAATAKRLVETKTKEAWTKDKFEENIAQEYPDMQKDFIEALARCIEHYSPPVNLPDELAW